MTWVTSRARGAGVTLTVSALAPSSASCLHSCISCEMQGGGELTLCPWGGYGRGPFRTSDGRYYCLDHKTGMTYWLSLEPPAHLQAEAARLAGKRRPWDKKPADADADAKRPKLNTEGGGEEGAYNHLAFQMPASTSVRVGDSFQARVPGFAPRAAPAEDEERGDELLEIQFSPLTSPPKRKLPPEPLAAAAAAASADAQAADAAAQAAADEEDARLTEEHNEDPDDALAAIGLEVGDVCLAWGLNAGTRRQFKALLLTMLTLAPALTLTPTLPLALAFNPTLTLTRRSCSTRAPSSRLCSCATSATSAASGTRC